MGLGEFFRWGLILQVIALVHFVRRRPEGFWLMIILFFGAPGALVYIVIEVLPDANLLAGVAHGFSRRRRIKVLEAVVEGNPAVGNLEELADLLLEERQFARARDLYSRIITPRTDALDPVYRRGIAHLELKTFKDAVADFERVVTADPKYDFNRAIGLLAHAYALSGDAVNAEAAFARAIDVSTLSETEYNYAAFLVSQNRNEDARAAVQRLVSRYASIPRYLQRRERPWFRKSKALLKMLR
jgi:hypothetical protein